MTSTASPQPPTLHQPSRTGEGPDSDGRPATFFGAIGTVFRRYAEFRGRATRSEFWWWTLFTVLASAALGAIPFDSSAVSGSPYIAIWSVAVLLPSLAVQVRRLRDAGYGWANMFWILLPVAGLIVLVVLSAQPSRPHAPNARTTAAGPDPIVL